MLVGRGELVTRIDWVVASARAGAGAALLLRGVPGAGKSALLAAARETASAAGLRVVAISGAEDERELPYAGLHALLRSLEADAVDLVPAHRAALDSALGRDDGPPPGPLVVATAALAVVDARSAAAPLLVAVDDLHWIDAESRAVIAFVARRITDNAAAVIATARPPLALAGLETADVPDLDTGPSLDLLRAQGATDEVAEQLVGSVGGNPLALLEVCATLTADQREGRRPLPDPLPLTTAGAAYAAQLAAADAQVRTAGGVAATSGEIDARALHEVLERRGSSWSALCGLEALGLATVDLTGVRWRHPLARAAARDALDPVVRRAAHLATAEVLEESGGDAAAIAWHFVRAAAGPDPLLAQRISTVAATASARGAHVAAAEAFAAAAALLPDRTRSAEASARSGIQRWYADDAHRARPVLEQALPDIADDDLRWDAALTLAQVVGAIDAPAAAYDAHRTTVDVARRQGRRDREVRALANSYNSSMHVGPEASGSVVREIVDATDGSDPVQLARRDAVLGFDDLNADRTESGRAHLESAMDRIESDALLAVAPDLLQLTVQAVMWSGRTERLRPQITAVVAQLAAQGDLRLLPSTLRGLAWCDYGSGRWQSAAELADQALDLSRGWATAPSTSASRSRRWPCSTGSAGTWTARSRTRPRHGPSPSSSGRRPVSPMPAGRRAWLCSASSTSPGWTTRRSASPRPSGPCTRDSSSRSTSTPRWRWRWRVAATRRARCSTSSSRARTTTSDRSPGPGRCCAGCTSRPTPPLSRRTPARSPAHWWATTTTPSDAPVCGWPPGA